MNDKIALQYFVSNDGTHKFNNQLIQQIMEYYMGHDMKECEYYGWGVLRGKEYKK